MNKKNLLKIIKQEIALLADFVDGFSDTENLHPMEVELAVSKAKDIYNELLLLKGDDARPERLTKEEVQAPKSKVEPAKVVKSQESNLPVEVAIELEEEIVLDNEPDTDEKLESEEILPFIEMVSEAVFVPVENAVPANAEKVVEHMTVELEAEKESLEIPEPIIEKVEAESNKETESVDVKIEEPATKPIVDEAPVLTPKKAHKSPKTDESKEKVSGEIMADKFSKDSLSINDMLAGVKNNKNLASSLKDSPITDLKKAIKLNDRIWYINELFNKNSSSFEKAVDTVNNSADLDKALEYLFTNFKWDQERKSTINFLELVFRRFATK